MKRKETIKESGRQDDNRKEPMYTLRYVGHPHLHPPPPPHPRRRRRRRRRCRRCNRNGSKLAVRKLKNS
ncbi:hypothetical protein V1477_001017 [Vespula maculifrons]|uniref:Uncharacterized protein n=1 Tax=Vespula maculifrons TaxID=7453 RepID=A0ABD2D1W4_VESMC